METLASLDAQMRSYSDGFEDIKNRLIRVETSFHKNLKDLETDFRRESRRSSSCLSLSDRKSKEEVLLNVGDLESDYGTVKNFEKNKRLIHFF